MFFVVKLKELLMLANIMGERLRDEAPDEQLLLRCLEPVWSYIYPYETIDYIKKLQEADEGEIDRRKMRKLLRILNGSRRQWLSFIIGLCYTYRERHSPARNRHRLAKKLIRLGKPATAVELDELAEAFRRQARQYATTVQRLTASGLEPAELASQIKLAKTLCHEENLPRFLLLYRHLNGEDLLRMAPDDVLEQLKRRYDNPHLLTQSYDLLQEYIALNDSLWQQFKKLLAASVPSH
jgi:hypothetical protein